MMKYQTYLIDADDTLFDFDKAEESAFKHVFCDAGLPYSAEALSLYRSISKILWDRFEQAEITKDELQDRRFRELFAALGVEMNPKTMNDAYVLALGAGAFLLDGAEEICRTLVENQKQIYIVTNGVAITQKLRIGNASIRKYISGVFVSEDAGYQKPQREYFAYVFSQIPNLDPASTIIVGDSLESDIRGGIQAGIDTCWFNRDDKQNTTSLVPTYEIKQLMELAGI